MALLVILALFSGYFFIAFNLFFIHDILFLLSPFLILLSFYCFLVEFALYCLKYMISLRSCGSAEMALDFVSTVDLWKSGKV